MQTAAAARRKPVYDGAVRLTTFRPLVLVAVVAAASAAVADNAALTSGGQPEMLSSHRSVAMASEVVRLTVHWNRVDTDCSFLFVNHGKACKVNMGFPDFGLWGYDYPRKKPETMFRQYHSFVDGKPVKTKLVLGKGGREQWQTKTVSFSAGASRSRNAVSFTLRLMQITWCAQAHAAFSQAINTARFHPRVVSYRRPRSV